MLLLSSLVNAKWPLMFAMAGVQVPGQMWLLLGALETPPGQSVLGWKSGSPHSALSCPGDRWLIKGLAGSCGSWLKSDLWGRMLEAGSILPPALAVAHVEETQRPSPVPGGRLGSWRQALTFNQIMCETT